MAPCGGVGANFSTKNQNSQKYLKLIWIDSIFNADFESDISFDLDSSIFDKKGIWLVKNVEKSYPERNVTRNYASDHIF
jgi:hypothetical protein